MFIAIVLAVIILAALILESLPGASHAVFDAELGLVPCPTHPEAGDLPGGHLDSMSCRAPARPRWFLPFHSR
ncbi:hypothetical protein G3N56_18865 [Desulfovibrio sulfodismutans]|uniref:Uncharacterized protein n=1 Tax=Desulfolutivibrio sulfodismutans TaxID=63561 RepID=A0A7K3NSG6_9BACT|nr:hypothetical protein [Desulfolutivibrio sulfodismutans]NDY58803.1 hypothetical protein [Desulfolutivibrio sulfodismutans]QLA11545.1 hypothetical protein GD606_04260 [Desulfolutivibrio sulfodismutans DSM 3696]